MVIPLIIYYVLPIFIGIFLMRKIQSYEDYNFKFIIAFLILVMISLFLDFDITSSLKFDDYVLVIFVPLLISYLSGLIYMYIKLKH
jgi:hypothetical protein